MSSIRPCQLPEASLLRIAVDEGAYADCYTADIGNAVTHAQYVVAFYASPLFKVERLVLAIAISRKSTDADVQRLAEGTLEAFAAWRVEARAANQLLLADTYGRTRSWLMTEALPDSTGTRLYFGSAVGAKRSGATGASTMGFAFRALLGFHRLYSRALLRAAAARLRD